MRLHHLTVSAFGPFAGTEHVDFDVLNDAGLFLMTGATGAGKTSLLDAVCFALYGTVPGVREVRSLRSQHSSPEAVPEVVLDFTVRGRRFLLRRRPEWQRPKRRGTGTTSEKASASITELTDGTERFLSARAAEVGLLVRELMGMNAGQFTQVALLPQGEFQVFLRASSQERHDVLQQLFRTDRFARIEEWVGEHSRRLREEAQDGRDSVQRLLDTVAERSGAALPGDLAGEDLPVAASDGRVLRWVGEVAASAAFAAEAATARHTLAIRSSRAAGLRLEEGRRRAEQRTRRDGARRELARLGSTEAEAHQVRDRLDLHERALRCLPLVDELSLAERDSRAVDDRLRAAVGAFANVALPEAGPAGWAPEAVVAWLGTVVDGPAGAPVPVGSPPGTSPGASPGTLLGTGATTADDAQPAHVLALLLTAARDQVARWSALVPRERAALEALRSRERDRRELERAQHELTAAEARCAELPGAVERIERDLEQLAGRAARRHALEGQLAAATDRHRAATALPSSSDRLRDLQDAERDARDDAQDGRSHLQDLVARRLAGMAAELAGGLTDGAPCQVCGSTDHPARAKAAHDAVTDADHAAADERLVVATAELDRVRRVLHDHQRAHDALVVASDGRDAEGAAAEVAAASAALADAEASARAHEQTAAELRALRREQGVVAEQQSAAASTVARLTELVAAHDRTVEQVTAELAAELGEGRSAATAAATLGTWTDRLATAREEVVERDRARVRLADVSSRCRASWVGQGFDDVVAVRASELADAERDRLAGWLRDRETSLAKAHAVLDETAPDSSGTDESGGERTDDLEQLARDAVHAEEEAASAAAEATLEQDRAAAAAALQERLVTALENWAPLRDTSLRAEGIARLVKGRGHDNQLQMRLSAYVLATRLDQVVAAANERLAHMRDQRYVLQRTDRAERRGTQAGLGLEVVDQWTGEARAPSTLSGGETFVVSLALALGLADVVTHEAGGTEVETLFVDEGFGTLDADTLDDVMDRLDGLRAGGRTVGVVSHVSELRDRIPVQVVVEKGRNGSTVTVRSLVGA